MTKLKLIGTALALSLSSAAYAAGASCCADMACCKEGANCCKKQDGKPGGNGHDMSGMRH